MDVDPETRRRDRDHAVGRRLAEMRTRRGLSQAEFAAGLIDASFISLVESGLRRPSIEHLEDLADRLGTTRAWLADGTPDPSSADTTRGAGARALLAVAEYFEQRLHDGIYELRTFDVVQELRRQASSAG